MLQLCCVCKSLSWYLYKTPGSPFCVLSHVSSLIFFQPLLFRLKGYLGHKQSLTCVFIFPKGAPIVVSFPHFYQADPKYINAVDGLSPNKEEHETYLDLQPVRQIFTTPTDLGHVEEPVVNLDLLVFDRICRFDCHVISSSICE